MFQVGLVMLASKYVDLIVPGYTHLQRAQPVLLPHLLLSYVEQVIDLAFLEILQHWSYITF
jgi:argininosuccinate lyase